jgi:hypothetical protein
MKFFLDSGGFSAFTKGAVIDVYDYCDFIKRYNHVITHYSVLDDMLCAEKTLENQRIMEEQGLNPIPCFHYNEDPKYLEYYIENYDYISLGGMVPVTTKDLIPWLDNIFRNYICDKDGYPKVKVHGFGLTAFNLMFRYPWYSVDSSSWLQTARFGGILVPKKAGGEFNWATPPVNIAVSNRSPSAKDHGKHYFTMSDSEKQVVDEYLASIGYKIGVSEFNEYDEETILEEGVSNSYLLRFEVNLIYYRELQSHFEVYPRQFNVRHTGGLFG